MKAKDIIDKYCRLYGVTMPSLDLSKTDYFVTIDSSQARVVLNKRSTLLGQIVCSAMKKGIVLHVRNGWVKPLLWENWKEFWSKYFAPQKKERKPMPEPCRERLKEPTMFDDAMTSRPRKKVARKGFEVTFNSNRNLNLMGSYIPTTPIG